MSLSGALSNAVSGLTLSSRRTEVIGANVANATTEGYARRSVDRSAASVGGDGAGVRIDGVSREVDTALVTDRRSAEAGKAASGRAAGFWRDIEQAIGVPEDAGSLSGRIADFESRLVSAGSDPGSANRLAAVRDSAQALAGSIAETSGAIQDRRMKAEADITSAVDRLNNSLSEIADLNGDIRVATSRGRDAAALTDQRRRLIDDVSQLVPVREVARPGGQVALYTPTGAALVDPSPAEIGFSRAGTIVPGMTRAGGALAPLTLNGKAVDMATANGPLAGGELAAMFAERDELATTAQGEIDALARDLVERFQDPGLDPTLAPGAAGLFTDGGGAFAPADETGLAGRIGVNPAADPAAGGALWRLRDGLGATAQGPAGDATLLTGMRDALNAGRVPASGSTGSAARSAAELTGAVTGLYATSRQAAEADGAAATARFESLREAELGDGVDTDREMQKLLEVESAYAANARVVQTIRDMFDTLERL